MENLTLEKIVNMCNQRGIIFAGSEIYGGLGNTWDYGPIGHEIKSNIKREWWKRFVYNSPNTFGVDAAILMNPRVWEASGHVAGFSDPKIDCKDCKTRHRADNLIEAHATKTGKPVNTDSMSDDELNKYLTDNKIKCPKCGNSNFTDIRQFNLMFETSRGVTEGGQSKIYLRPETAQGEFVNFINIQRTMRAKVPFGIAQIGKAFRNEVTPGNFIFRTIEFEQMEHQLFCKEGQDEAFYEEYKTKAWDFLLSLGFKAENLKFKPHDKLSHYAKAACDINYKFPMGWSELNGIHNRTNYDLSRHQEYSGKGMLYLDPVSGEKYIPWVVEYSIGADRLMLAVLCEAYNEEKLEDGDTRTVLKLHPKLAAYKAAVFPLQKNLGEKAMEVFNTLNKHFYCAYDEAGSIGKRYRRQDEIGTPYCITVDFTTLENGIVTLRDRDTMQQQSMTVDEVVAFIKGKLE
ncbi:MAG: glycine--tRNA ligase [Firmicutes bacterium]|nr:glycine--tRNA ligase [Bacillota bacterium]